MNFEDIKSLVASLKLLNTNNVTIFVIMSHKLVIFHVLCPDQACQASVWMKPSKLYV